MLPEPKSPAPIPRQWEGETVAVIGTGPSLTAAQIAAVGRAGWRMVAVNDAYKLAPTADLLYACDGNWVRLHEGAAAFAGERWTHDWPAAVEYRWRWIRCLPLAGFSRNPTFTHCGGSSTYQAANVALLMGAARIVLLGVDNQPSADGKVHFFGSHPKGFSEGSWAIYETKWGTVLETLPTGVELVNASPNTALQAIPCRALAELIA